MTPATSFWKNPVGYITLDRKTVAILSQERRSTHALFDILAVNARIEQSYIPMPYGFPGELWAPGTYCFGLRKLAKGCRFSVATLRRGLARLVELKLIRKRSNKLGTVVQVLNFSSFLRKNRNAEHGHTPDMEYPEAAESQKAWVAREAARAIMAPPKGTRVLNSDPFICSSPTTLSRSLPSYVHGVTSQGEIEWVRPGTGAGDRVKAILESLRGRLSL